MRGFGCPSRAGVTHLPNGTKNDPLHQNRSKHRHSPKPIIHLRQRACDLVIPGPRPGLPSAMAQPEKTAICGHM
jgi:hypothetical protein